MKLCNYYMSCQRWRSQQCMMSLWALVICVTNRKLVLSPRINNSPTCNLSWNLWLLSWMNLLHEENKKWNKNRSINSSSKQKYYHSPRIFFRKAYPSKAWQRSAWYCSQIRVNWIHKMYTMHCWKPIWIIILVKY